MQEFTIGKNEAGQRLDKYLGRILKEAPVSFFYKMMRKNDKKLLYYNLNISLLYSAIVLSDEKKPALAIFISCFLPHALWSS